MKFKRRWSEVGDSVLCLWPWVLGVVLGSLFLAVSSLSLPLGEFPKQKGKAARPHEVRFPVDNDRRKSYNKETNHRRREPCTKFN